MKNIKGIRRKDKYKMLELIAGDISEKSSRTELMEIISGYSAGNRFSAEEAFAAADAEYKKASCVSYLTILDSRYPAPLREIYDPPFVLYYRGELPLSWEKSVAVVGTRYASGAALKAAYDMGFGLGVNGVAVVSGLALGIDKHAHTGSVDSRMASVAVLGNGIDKIYPAENRSLGYRLLDCGGAILSELSPGTPPSKYTFPQRNRIISGLSKAAVIIQAPENSGALITADFAAEQGRDLYVHGTGLAFPEGKGGRDLFLEGAPALFSPLELLEDQGWDIPVRDYTVKRRSFGNSSCFLEKEMEGSIVNHCGTYFMNRKYFLKYGISGNDGRKVYA